MRVWFSPYGTEWEAETYEEALEMERDSLVEQLEAEVLYAAEGWSWLNKALEALGVKTVFDIPESNPVKEPESHGDTTLNEKQAREYWGPDHPSYDEMGQ